jgi:hypothetical protein
MAEVKLGDKLVLTPKNNAPITDFLDGLAPLLGGHTLIEGSIVRFTVENLKHWRENREVIEDLFDITTEKKYEQTVAEGM